MKGGVTLTKLELQFRQKYPYLPEGTDLIGALYTHAMAPNLGVLDANEAEHFIHWRYLQLPADQETQLVSDVCNYVDRKLEEAAMSGMSGLMNL